MDNLVNTDLPPMFIYKHEGTEHKYALINPKYEYFLKKRKYLSAGIPDMYCNITFDNYKGINSLADVKQLEYYAHCISNPTFDNINIYLWSLVPGCQKTAIACNILKTCIDTRFNGQFISMSDLVHVLVQVQGYTPSEISVKTLDDLYENDILVVDDCFNPRTSPMWKNSPDLIIAALDDFFRSFISSSKKLILTSNNNLPYIQEKYGENLVSLIRRNFKVIELKDPIEDFKEQDINERFSFGVQKCQLLEFPTMEKK